MTREPLIKTAAAFVAVSIVFVSPGVGAAQAAAAAFGGRQAIPTRPTIAQAPSALALSLIRPYLGESDRVGPAPLLGQEAVARRVGDVSAGVQVLTANLSEQAAGQTRQTGDLVQEILAGGSPAAADIPVLTESGSPPSAPNSVGGLGVHAAGSPAPGKVSPPVVEGARPSRWYDRLFSTQRRAAEAYGAVVGFWTGLATGELSGDAARKALRELSLDEYTAASRFKNVDATLLGMRGAMRSGNLEISEILDLLQSKSGMRSVASTKVFVDKTHHFDMYYAPKGSFQGSSSYQTDGETFVYSLTVYQVPGATPESPALLHLTFQNPSFIGLGDALRKTSFVGLSSRDGLYLVKDLSSLGEAGRLAGDTRLVLDSDAVGKGLAAVVTALDAAKNPSLENSTLGFGRIGTDHFFRVIDPASGVVLNQEERTKLYEMLLFGSVRSKEQLAQDLVGQQVGMLGTYIVRRFLGEDVSKRPVIPRSRVPWVLLPAFGILGAFGLGTLLLTPLMLTAEAAAAIILGGVSALLVIGVLASSFAALISTLPYSNRAETGFAVLLGLSGPALCGLVVLALFGAISFGLGGTPLLASLLSSSDLALAAAGAGGLSAVAASLAAYVRNHPAVVPPWRKLAVAFSTATAAVVAAVLANVAAAALLPKSALILGLSSWLWGHLPAWVLFLVAPTPFVLLGVFAALVSAIAVLLLSFGVRYLIGAYSGQAEG